jgi:hypothetical protein
MRTNLMKQAGLVIATALVSGQAFAGPLNVDSRFDYTSVNPDEKARALGTETSAAFKVSRLRLDYQGKAFEGLTYRVRLNMLAAGAQDTTTGKYYGASVSERDGVTGLVDFAYITHQMTENQALTLGKQVLMLGGHELSNNPGDMYFISEAGKELAAFFMAGGATLANVYGDHKFVVSVANNSTDVTNGTTSYKFNQTRNLAVLGYVGKFMDGSLQPIFDYGTEGYVATSGTGYKNTYMTLGLRYTQPTFGVDAEYHTNQKSADDAASTKNTTTSMYVNARYNLNDTMGLLFKMDNAQKKTEAATSTTDKYVTTGLAFEYKPMKDVNFRYHASYNTQTITPDGLDGRTTNTIYVGARWLADVLK